MSPVERTVEQPALFSSPYVTIDGTRFVPFADLMTHHGPDGVETCHHLSTDYCVVSRLAELRGEPDPHTRTPYLFVIIPPTTTHQEPSS